MDYTIIGKNIENLRNSKNMKQEEFANIMGISRPTVSNWEQGKNPPTTDQLIKLAEEFHISIDELLGLKKSKRIKNYNNSLTLALTSSKLSVGSKR